MLFVWKPFPFFCDKNPFTSGGSTTLGVYVLTGYRILLVENIGLYFSYKGTIREKTYKA